MRVNGGWSVAIADYGEYQLAMGIMRSSIATRRQHLQRVARTIGVEDPWAVTAEQLVAYVAAQEWMPETKRSRRTTLRGFYRWGVESRFLVESPAARLPRYAFPGRDRGHLSPRWVGKVMTRLLAEGWTMHKLRHRAGTRWWEVSGGDVFAVQELLGHADPKTTKVYVKVSSDRLRTIVDAAA